MKFGLENDQRAGAIVGKFWVTNTNKNLLTRLINIKTLTFQWLAQAGRWFWFKMTTIPGTNFAIRRPILEKLGGWDEKALSEDMELSFRVYNLGYYIRFFISCDMGTRTRNMESMVETTHEMGHREYLCDQ